MAEAAVPAAGGAAGIGVPGASGAAASDGDVRARVRVRYFAAAKAAAGVGTEVRDVAEGCTIDQLLDDAGFGAIPVFGRSTFLLNGVTTTDRTHPLRDGDELDVLPPFAGG
ncbi:MoaD/ThiS family protein [Subtercola sp. YIM 133946]|uniref:MoaD/ThiS family protein n=1 Tax=Subtercola sp. YIM 133946 TaxID=3118909 RepID=UPI002F94F78F